MSVDFYLQIWETWDQYGGIDACFFSEHVPCRWWEVGAALEYTQKGTNQSQRGNFHRQKCRRNLAPFFVFLVFFKVQRAFIAALILLGRNPRQTESLLSDLSFRTCHLSETHNTQNDRVCPKESCSSFGNLASPARQLVCFCSCATKKPVLNARIVLQMDSPSPHKKGSCTPFSSKVVKELCNSTGSIFLQCENHIFDELSVLRMLLLHKMFLFQIDARSVQCCWMGVLVHWNWSTTKCFHEAGSLVKVTAWFDRKQQCTGESSADFYQDSQTLAKLGASGISSNWHVSNFYFSEHYERQSMLVPFSVRTPASNRHRVLRAPACTCKNRCTAHSLLSCNMFGSLFLAATQVSTCDLVRQTVQKNNDQKWISRLDRIPLKPLSWIPWIVHQLHT